jgi:hypothetical protein
MKTILVERFPDGSFSTYDGNGYLSFCKDPLDACDRSWCLLERDANPNKDKGAVLVEYTVTATPTGRTNLFRHGRLIEMRFNQYNTEGYSAEALAMLNKAFESIMDANAETWTFPIRRGRTRLPRHCLPSMTLASVAIACSDNRSFFQFFA